MSKNTAKVKINIINQAFSINASTSGLIYAIGETAMGPDNDPKDIITSVPNFERIFGSENGTPFSKYCAQALQAGAMLRVCRVVGAGADVADSQVIPNAAAATLFSFISKEKGAYNNDMEAIVEAASSGLANQFNLTIQNTETGKEEVYTNLEVTQVGAASPYNYLKKISDSSKLVSPVYADISGLSGDQRPVNGTYTFSGGVDGAAPLIGAYSGNAAAKTGLRAFDEYDDAYMLFAFGKNETNMDGIAAVGSAYAEARGDLVYLQHLDNAHTDTTTIPAEITDSGVSSKHMGFIGGGARYVDTVNGGVVSKDALGELAGVIANSHQLNGVWASPTNLSNGRLPSAVGIVNNFGSPASSSDLNILANAGANMVIHRYGVNMLWDFYSMAAGESPEKFLTVVLAQIYLKKNLQPFLERFLSKPNTPETWASIYYGVKPFLDNLVGSVFVSYEWFGDQFAQGQSSYQINDPVEVGQGKYKAQLKGVMVVPMVEFTLDIILARTENEVVIS